MGMELSLASRSIVVPRRLRPASADLSGWSLLAALRETPTASSAPTAHRQRGSRADRARRALASVGRRAPRGGRSQRRRIAAAHVAGALSLDDALPVAHHRGRLQQRPRTGGMLAVGLGAAEAAR